MDLILKQNLCFHVNGRAQPEWLPCNAPSFHGIFIKMNDFYLSVCDSPPRLCDDHLGAQLVELVPQRLHLQLHLRPHQRRVQGLLLHRRRVGLRLRNLGVAVVGVRLRLLALGRRLAIVR